MSYPSRMHKTQIQRTFVLHRCGADGADAQVVMFGGDTGLACSRLNDVWTFPIGDLSAGSASWERLQTTGERPQARSNCATAICDDELFIYGGWDNSGVCSLFNWES